MLRFEFSILKLWGYSGFRTYWSTHKILSKHKMFEAELIRDGYNLLGLSIDLSWRGRDHAGPRIEICIWGYALYLHLYDVRHWDYITKSWVTHETTT